MPFPFIEESMGYVGIWLVSWLIIFGFPLPNEMAFAYPGMISALYSYNQFFAFVIAYSGLVVHIVVGYSIGRGLITRYPIKRQLQSREKIMDIINKVEKYGRIGILFSFFIPGIRLFFPYVCGTLKLNSRDYFFFSFIGSLLWSLLFFQVGRIFPTQFPFLIEGLSRILLYIVVIFLGCFSFTSFIYKRIIKRSRL
ncbi:hypothetical protein Q73_07220 [Bacillus coahuilensis m2-6]|uniref:DedA family protein n=1 Tax=Bacillus coahuilensis TaxID=408580 RepID=UPI0007502054|nr:hypothetical protein Q73_07220 [Bacillus coahuilensis m2-6]